MIYAANEAALAFFQLQAGYTRLGSHAGRVNGGETGQWREADLAVASWYQHTSCDGDPQLHVHNQILHAALTGHDGKWRAPDSYRYGEHVGAATQVFLAVLESPHHVHLPQLHRPAAFPAAVVFPAPLALLRLHQPMTDQERGQGADASTVIVSLVATGTTVAIGPAVRKFWKWARRFKVDVEGEPDDGGFLDE
jgi:hypothetical protein